MHLQHSGSSDLWVLIGLWGVVQMTPWITFYFAFWAYQTFTTRARVMVRTNLLGWIMFATWPAPDAPYRR